MREPLLVKHPDLASFADRDGGGGPFADPINRDDRSLLEGGRIESARRMGEMVLGEKYLARPPVSQLREHPLQLIADPGLFSKPHRHAHEEGAQTAWCHLRIGGENACEFGQRLVVEDQHVEFAGFDFPFLEAISDGIPRNAGIVLLARESLLLSGGYDVAVAHQASGAVVVQRADAENVHWRADKLGFRRAGATQSIHLRLLVVTSFRRYSE